MKRHMGIWYLDWRFELLLTSMLNYAFRLVDEIKSSIFVIIRIGKRQYCCLKWVGYVASL
jgi:hypothetical protein